MHSVGPWLVVALVLVAIAIAAALSIAHARRARAAAREPKLRADREREMLAELFEDAPVIIALFEGPELEVAFVNARARALAGHTDVQGKKLGDAFPDQLGEGAFQELREAAITGRPVINLRQTLHLRGRELVVLSSYQPVRNLDGSLRGVLVTANDVTMQSQAMREAELARTQAMQANRAKDEFLAMLGHELRNPLSPLTTAVTLMRMHGETSRELDVIERQLAHMTRLVDDLLDISRIVRGNIELRRTHVDLRSVINKALEMIAPLYEQTGHHIDVAVPDGLIVDADLHRLTQVFANLIGNAIKFSRRDQLIEINAGRADERASISVTDHGAGIEPEMLAHVFEPFVQEPQATDRARGGLGLGLAIVRRLVELHGGTVTATSSGRGRGAVFTVELPLAVTVPHAERPLFGAIHHTDHGQRILVVDDNPDVAELLAELLETMGHTVRVAHDGPEALEAASTFAPTLALLDIGLPVMDGYEVAKRLRERGVLVPLIAITGYGQDRDRDRAREAGFAEHLVKPVHPEVLERVIHDLAA